MGKPKLTTKRIKKSRHKLEPLPGPVDKSVEDEIERALLNSTMPRPAPEGDELEYRKILQEQILHVCQEILKEHHAEIVKRAEERIKVMKTFYPGLR